MNKVLTGVLATSVIIAVSFLFIAQFDNVFFSTWLSFAFMACIPTQIVCGLVWQASYPKKIAELKQPLKGLGFLGLSMLGGLVFGPLMWFVVGGGLEPTPQLMMFTIFTVITTFWVVGVWQCWPISSLCSHPLSLGVCVLGVSYGAAYIGYLFLFNFEFLQGAPIYVKELDPQGLFMAWQVLSFCVTTVAVIMFCILCDFWPISHIETAQNNPATFGLLASIWVLSVAGLVFYIATGIFKVDYVVYMVRGPVSFVFGAFICLNMMQNALFSSLNKQPLRGVALGLFCIALAVAMQFIYQLGSQSISPSLSSGLPAYGLELWLANAMLAITFPIIVAHSDFFKLWPFGGVETKTESQGIQHHG